MRIQLYKTTLMILWVLSLGYIPGFGQFQDDFSSMDLKQWEGDTLEFIINEDERLQLNADGAGSSSLFTRSSFFDSLSFEMDLQLDFSPSDNNHLKIFLLVKKTDDQLEEAYYLKIGESGSEDKIRFLYWDGETESLLASGKTDLSKKINIRIRLHYSGDVVSLESQKPFQCTWDEEFSFVLPLDGLSDFGYFGLKCSYTASNTEKFSFDNIRISRILNDSIAPELLSYKIQDKHTLILSFDKCLDINSIINTSYFHFQPNLEIHSVDLLDGSEDNIQVYLSDGFESIHPYFLVYGGFLDLSGNSVKQDTLELLFYQAPETGTLLINEILFDPYPDNYDFLELINNSKKYLDLKGLEIHNSSNGSSSSVDSNYLMKPGQIIALTKAGLSLAQLYNTPDTAVIYDQNLPPFNNDHGKVVLMLMKDSVTMVLDSFEYSEDMHSPLLKNVEGISLERLSTTLDSKDPNNWHSAAYKNAFASPGYSNSVFIQACETDDPVYLSPKVFSPDGDAYKDLLSLHYDLSKPGFIANVDVYNDRGFRIRRLSQNELLGNRGFIIWNGTNSNGTIASVGMYIVSYVFLHPDGDILRGNKVCVLAQKLN